MNDIFFFFFFFFKKYDIDKFELSSNMIPIHN